MLAVISTRLDPLVITRPHPHPADSQVALQDETLLRAIVGVGRIGGTWLQPNQARELSSLAIEVQHSDPNPGSRPAHKLAVLHKPEHDAGEPGRGRPVGGSGIVDGGE